MIGLITGENSTAFAMVRVEPDLTKLDKEQLYPYLVSGYVADTWWSLSKTDREKLATNIVDWWSVPLQVSRYKWPVNGGWKEKVSECSIDTVVRISILGQSSAICSKGEYYQLYGADWYEFQAQPCFRLPCYIVHVSNCNFGHLIVGLQLGEDMAVFDNWRFFQYADGDIQPGDWQMPVETAGSRAFETRGRRTKVSIEQVTKKLQANSLWYETITEWQL